jgi:hypothetical protein
MSQTVGWQPDVRRMVSCVPAEWASEVHLGVGQAVSLVDVPV